VFVLVFIWQILSELKYEYLEEGNYEPFTLVVQEVLIILELCHFDGVKGLESFFSLDDINEMKIW
jgi:hypothetical protein